jgi:hypothetical protein
VPPERQLDPVAQDPPSIVPCASSPDVGPCQRHDGVDRSTDRARSWTALDTAAPSAFRFACAVHPRSPDAAWLGPAVEDEQRIPVDGRVVVSPTRDGGRAGRCSRTVCRRTTAAT